MNNFPQPFSCQRNYGYEHYECVPYSYTRWQEIVGKYGIQVPEIVDMTCGKSKCHECGAVYAGYQPKCEAKVIFYRRKDAYHGSRKYDPCYHEIYERECEAYLTWDMHTQFNLQKEFFALLNRVADLPDLAYDPLVKFRDSFPPGVAEALQVRLLFRDLEDVKMTLPTIKNAISTIAQQMSKAGSALSFNL